MRDKTNDYKRWVILLNLFDVTKDFSLFNVVLVFYVENNYPKPRFLN